MDFFGSSDESVGETGEFCCETRPEAAELRALALQFAAKCVALQKVRRRRALLGRIAVLTEKKEKLIAANLEIENLKKMQVDFLQISSERGKSKAQEELEGLSLALAAKQAEKRNLLQKLNDLRTDASARDAETQQVRSAMEEIKKNPHWNVPGFRFLRQWSEDKKERLKLAQHCYLGK